jgi:hypothetical protein
MLGDISSPSALHQGNSRCCLAPCCLSTHTLSLVHPRDIKSSIHHCLKTTHATIIETCPAILLTSRPRHSSDWAAAFAGKKLLYRRLGGSFHLYWRETRSTRDDWCDIKSAAALRLNPGASIPELGFTTLRFATLQHLAWPRARRAGHSSPTILLAFLRNRITTTLNSP